MKKERVDVLFGSRQATLPHVLPSAFFQATPQATYNCVLLGLGKKPEATRRILECDLWRGRRRKGRRGEILYAPE